MENLLASERVFQLNVNRKDDKARNGFTLVEILVVLVILGIMGGMVTTAVRGVSQTARESRTRSIISACDSVIQEHYEALKNRPLPVEMPTFGITEQPGPPPITFSNEVLAFEAARVRLIMVRDLLRMELPDKKLDIVSLSNNQQTPVSITAVANRVAADPVTGRVIREFGANRLQTTITWRGSGKLGTYFNRVPNPSSWTIEHEGAECLYLIMSTSFTAGSPAINAIPDANIGDLDSDGMPEILDGWGRPLGFVRWPVGFLDNNGIVDRSVPDDFDPFRVDFGFTVDTFAPPWAMRPLIVSRGWDGEFGMELSLSTENYAQQSWPLTDMNTNTSTKAEDESQGRTGIYFFPDPFLRHGTPVAFPGEIVNTETSADNITNYLLQATL